MNLVVVTPTLGQSEWLDAMVASIALLPCPTQHVLVAPGNVVLALAARAAFEQLGGFDSSMRFCGDSEFLARACIAGVPFVRVRGPAVAGFRLRAGQLTKNRSAMMAERARVDEKLGLLVPRLTGRH